MVQRQLQGFSKKAAGRILILFLLGLALIAIIFWGSAQFTHKTGTGTDFINRWLPVRLMLTEGLRNPYSVEATLRTELFRFGSPAPPGEAPGIFAYPLYTAILFLPFALIEDFVVTRSLFMTTSIVAHILLVVLTMHQIGFRPGKSLRAALLLYALLSADMAQALIDGNPASLTALFAWLTIFLASRKSDRAAGIMLALSTSKPQMVVLFTLLVWLWAASNRRWLIILYSILSMTVLISASFLYFPGWLSAFLEQILAYPGLASPSTPASILPYWMPDTIAAGLAVVLNVLSLTLIGWSWTRCLGKGSRALIWTACVTFTLMPLTGITSAKSNFVAMLPAVILVAAYFSNTLKAQKWFSVGVIAAICISWAVFLIGREQIYFIDFYPLPFFLIIVLLLDYFRNGSFSAYSVKAASPENPLQG